MMRSDYKTAFTIILVIIIANSLLLFFVSSLHRKEDNMKQYFDYEDRYRDSLYKVLIDVRKERIEVIKSIENLKDEISKTDKEIKERITKLNKDEKIYSNWGDSSTSSILDALRAK